jgi:hypothetical protein
MMNSEALHINQKFFSYLDASKAGVILNDHFSITKKTLDRNLDSLLCEPLRTFASFAVSSYVFPVSDFRQE